MPPKKTKRKQAKSNGATAPQATKNGSAKIYRRWRESNPNPMTREELATRMHCCMSTVRNWEDEHGTREPRVSQARMMEQIKPGLLTKLFRDELRATQA